jgi:AraC-like DNA-binding protein
MDLRIHRPAFPLSQYVESIWRLTSPGAPITRQRVYPDGAMSLFIHLDKPRASFSFDDRHFSMPVPLLAGPYSRPFYIDPSNPTEAIGVAFRPGAARIFFSIAAHELHNSDAPLSELHSSEADHLLNDVCSARGAVAQIQALEQYLNRKFAAAAPVHPAIRHAAARLSLDGRVGSIRQIQLASSLSHTRFIQLFREHVGLTPKLFCRVRRFHALLGQIKKGVPVNWAELAADCGYFDQAHLIRDFRAFAGITPVVYSQTIPEQDLQSLLANASS